MDLITICTLIPMRNLSMARASAEWNDLPGGQGLQFVYEKLTSWSGDTQTICPLQLHPCVNNSAIFFQNQTCERKLWMSWSSSKWTGLLPASSLCWHFISFVSLSSQIILVSGIECSSEVPQKTYGKISRALALSSLVVEICPLSITSFLCSSQLLTALVLSWPQNNILQLISLTSSLLKLEFLHSIPILIKEVKLLLGERKSEE